MEYDGRGHYVYEKHPKMEDCGYICLLAEVFASRAVIPSPLEVWRAEAAAANESLNDLLTTFGYTCLETLWEIAFITEDMEDAHAVKALPALLFLPAFITSPYWRRSRAPALRGPEILATWSTRGHGRAWRRRRRWRRTSL